MIVFQFLKGIIGFNLFLKNNLQVYYKFFFFFYIIFILCQDIQTLCLTNLVSFANLGRVKNKLVSSSISSHFAVWSPAPTKWPLFSFASNQSAPYLWLSSCLQCFKLSVHNPCPSPSASVFEPIYLLFFLFHLREPASCMSIAVLFQLIWDGCQVWDLHI